MHPTWQFIEWTCRCPRRAFQSAFYNHNLLLACNPHPDAPSRGAPPGSPFHAPSRPAVLGVSVFPQQFLMSEGDAMGVAHFVSRRGQAGGKARFGCLVKQLSSEVVTYFAINIWKRALVGLLIPKNQLASEWPLVWEGYELCLLRLRHRACRRFSPESSVRGVSSAVLPGAYPGAQRWDVSHLRPPDCARLGLQQVRLTAPALFLSGLQQ